MFKKRKVHLRKIFFVMAMSDFCVKQVLKYQKLRKQ